MLKNDLSLTEWLKYGYARGYCSDVVCDMHDGVPMTEQEIACFDEDGEVCIPVVRVWVGRDHPECH